MKFSFTRLFVLFISIVLYQCSPVKKEGKLAEMTENCPPAAYSDIVKGVLIRYGCGSLKDAEVIYHVNSEGVCTNTMKFVNMANYNRYNTGDSCKTLNEVIVRYERKKK